MPWFVYFESPSLHAHGVFSRRGISVTATDADDAIRQAREALSGKFDTRHVLDVFQYEENEDRKD